MTAAKPGVRPATPHFSSGPCAKRPGWNLQNLTDAVLGRSHRSKNGKAKLKRAIDLTREVLEVPADYRIGIVPASDTGAAPQMSAENLDNLVGRIALYPDDLVAIILPASTNPLQLVQADRFLDKRKTDTSLQPDQDWDPSILALINYPDVVERLNADLDWTQRLGDAVLDQQRHADFTRAFAGRGETAAVDFNAAHHGTGAGNHEDDQ